MFSWCNLMILPFFRWNSYLEEGKLQRRCWDRIRGHWIEQWGTSTERDRDWNSKRRKLLLTSRKWPNKDRWWEIKYSYLHHSLWKYSAYKLYKLANATERDWHTPYSYHRMPSKSWPRTLFAHAATSRNSSWWERIFKQSVLKFRH